MSAEWFTSPMNPPRAHAFLPSKDRVSECGRLRLTARWRGLIPGSVACANCARVAGNVPETCAQPETP